MSHPVITVRFEYQELEIRLSSFEETALETILEAIQNLHYDAIGLRKLLIPYGDPTKRELYRYGITIPKNVDADSFTNWLVEQLRGLQAELGDTFQINRMAAPEPMLR